MKHPVPEGWPDEFDPAAAEAVIETAIQDGGPSVSDLVVELRWAIAQLRCERMANEVLR